MAKKKTSTPSPDDAELGLQPDAPETPATRSNDVGAETAVLTTADLPTDTDDHVGEDTEMPPSSDGDISAGGQGSDDTDDPTAAEEPLDDVGGISDSSPVPDADHTPIDDATANDEPGDHGEYDDLLSELGETDSVAPRQEPMAPLVLDEPPPGEVASGEADYSDDDLLLLSEDRALPGDMEQSGDQTPAPTMPVAPTASPAPRRDNKVLTIEARAEVQTEEDRRALVWHEIQNSHWTRRILTGTLDGVEKTESGLTLAVVNYKGFRVAIPIKEMLLYKGKMPSGRDYLELMERLQRILSARLGSEIDFIVKGHDNKTRSVVASRKEAMYKKRQTFYMDVNDLGEHLIYEGRVVQARVVAVAEKVIRVEVFGVETSIVARNLSWEWLGNARDHFSVGDRILVRVLRIEGKDVENLTISADVRTVSSGSNRENLKNCLPQSKYAGKVTDVRNGVVFVRLNNGVNGIAHSCYDHRYPGKKDDVSFAVTRIDEEQGVAVGIITRIIKQNL